MIINLALIYEPLLSLRSTTTTVCLSELPDMLLRLRLRTRYSRQRAFTIIELLVAVTIGAILLALGAPALTAMIAVQHVKTATYDFYANLALARSEAIKRNAVVTITPRGGNFANGYDLQVGTEILKSQLETKTVAYTAPVGVALAFGGDGRLTIATRYQLELTSTRSSGVSKRCLVISPAGRPSIRIDKSQDGNCING